MTNWTKISIDVSCAPGHAPNLTSVFVGPDDNSDIYKVTITQKIIMSAKEANWDAFKPHPGWRIRVDEKSGIAFHEPDASS